MLDQSRSSSAATLLASLVFQSASCCNYFFALAVAPLRAESAAAGDICRKPCLTPLHVPAARNRASLVGAHFHMASLPRIACRKQFVVRLHAFCHLRYAQHCVSGTACCLSSSADLQLNHVIVGGSVTP